MENEEVIKVALKEIHRIAIKDMRMETLREANEYTECIHKMFLGGYKLGHLNLNDDYRKYALDKIWPEVYPSILEGSKEIVFKLKKKMTVQQVSAITAKCLIEEIMQRHHWEFNIEPLLYKVKVQIVLGNHKKAVFYLRYVNLHEDLMNMEEGMTQFEKVFQTFKRNVTISEIGNKDEWNK